MWVTDVTAVNPGNHWHRTTEVVRIEITGCKLWVRRDIRGWLSVVVDPIMFDVVCLSVNL